MALSVSVIAGGRDLLTLVLVGVAAAGGEEEEVGEEGEEAEEGAEAEAATERARLRRVVEVEVEVEEEEEEERASPETMPTTSVLRHTR